MCRGQGILRLVACSEIGCLVSCALYPPAVCVSATSCGSKSSAVRMVTIRTKRQAGSPSASGKLKEGPSARGDNCKRPTATCASVVNELDLTQP